MSLALLIICLLSAVSGFYGLEEPPVRTTIDSILKQSNKGPVTGRSFGGREKIVDGYDMLLSPKQYKRLYQGDKSRSAGHTISTPWTDGVIPYVIKESEFTAKDVQMIKAAMKTWEGLTCIRFRRNTTFDENVVVVHTGNDQGCSASLGMNGGEQVVNLGHGCIHKGTIEHELGHTMGMIHEHQRPQRDGYVRVNYYEVEKAQVGWLVKYAKGSDDKMGLEYDYTSIMHYGRTAFNKDYAQTIYTRDPSQEYVIGMAPGPSFLDAKFINLMYKCQDRCKSPRQCGDDCFLTEECKCTCKEDVGQKEPCENNDKECQHWAQIGECGRIPKYMDRKCPLACGICQAEITTTQEPCLNEKSECEEWAKIGECQRIPEYMALYCRPACGTCGEMNTDSQEPEPCKDKRKDCQALAGRGECTRNPEMMLKDCKQTCNFCQENLGEDPTAKPGCVDYDFVCQYLADLGMCQKLKTSMGTQCAQHCGTCDANIKVPETCVDLDIHCWTYAVSGLCDRPGMRGLCPRSCSACPDEPAPTTAVNCYDNSRSCPEMARQGSCRTKPDFMLKYCKRSCSVC